MNLVPIIYSFSIIISSLISFTISTDGMFINRTFLNMPLSIIENGVINKNNDLSYETNVNDEEELNYYFDIDLTKTNIKTYLNLNLEGKVDRYNLAFKFYFKQEDSFIETSNYPNAMQVRLLVNYYANFKIDSYLSFYIKEGEIEKYE